MRERDDGEDDDCTDDPLLGQAPIGGATPTVRVRLHRSEAPIRDLTAPLPLAHKSGPQI